MAHLTNKSQLSVIEQICGVATAISLFLLPVSVQCKQLLVKCTFHSLKVTAHASRDRETTQLVESTPRKAAEMKTDIGSGVCLPEIYVRGRPAVRE
jgi:hypothetical protein